MRTASKDSKLIMSNKKMHSNIVIAHGLCPWHPKSKHKPGNPSGQVREKLHKLQLHNLKERQPQRWPQRHLAVLKKSSDSPDLETTIVNCRLATSSKA